MNCLSCGCELHRVRLEVSGYEMLIRSGMFAGREVEGMACPMCGRMELRVKIPWFEIPEEHRKMMEEDK